MGSEVTGDSKREGGHVQREHRVVDDEAVSASDEDAVANLTNEYHLYPIMLMP